MVDAPLCTIDGCGLAAIRSRGGSSLFCPEHLAPTGRLTPEEINQRLLDARLEELERDFLSKLREAQELRVTVEKEQASLWWRRGQATVFAPGRVGNAEDLFEEDWAQYLENKPR